MPELFPTILFIGFVGLCIYTFFYEILMSFYRRVTRRPAVGVGTVPVPEHVSSRRAEEEREIARAGPLREREREQLYRSRINQELRTQLDNWLHGGMGRQVRPRHVIGGAVMGLGGMPIGGNPYYGNHHMMGQPAPPQLSPQEIERRKLLEEQEREYQKALQADQEMRMREEALRRLEQERKEQEEAMRREEEARRLAEERERQERRERRIARLNALPAAPNLNEDENAIEIALRLPDGMRITRCFSAHDSLESVRAFIEGSSPDIAPYKIVLGISKTGLEPDQAPLSHFNLGRRALLNVYEV